LQIIKDLTPEHFWMLAAHNREWRTIATRTGSTDRGLVENAIAKLYAVTGHAQPDFVWSESPHQMLTALANTREHTGLVPMRDALVQALQPEPNEVEARKYLRPILLTMGPAPFERFMDQQPALVMETLPDSLRSLMIGCLSEIFIGLELDWISFHDFCDRHLGVKYEPKRLEQIRLWSEIARSCYWWAPYETTCFVSERPATLHIDARERLHNLQGPAMAFNDGWSLFALHGAFVSQRLVMHPHEARLDDLPLDENLDVLHATIEMLGHDRFLAAAQARMVNEDAFGRLYRILFHDYEPLMMVEVVNATPEPDGSARRNLLRVPPETESAREAVAWSFGRRASDYDPAVQT